MKMSLWQIFQNFQNKRFLNLEFEQKLSFFADSEIMKNQLQGHLLGRCLIFLVCYVTDEKVPEESS